MVKKKIKSYFCPAQAATDVIGGKWNLVILWFLSEKNYRFKELFREIPEISEGVLNRQLKELEKDDVINRRVISDMPLKVEYSLSSYGKTLKPVIKSSCEWGMKHIDKNDYKLNKPDKRSS